MLKKGRGDHKIPNQWYAVLSSKEVKRGNQQSFSLAGKMLRCKLPANATTLPHGESLTSKEKVICTSVDNEGTIVRKGGFS